MVITHATLQDTLDLAVYKAEVFHCTAGCLIEEIELFENTSGSHVANPQHTCDAASLEDEGRRNDRANSARPQFDAITRALTFRGEVVRTYTPRATNCLAVLQAFEEEGWPLRIDDPLKGGKDAARLNLAVRSLNRELRRIRFHAGGDGESFEWRVRTHRVRTRVAR